MNNTQKFAVLVLAATLSGGAMASSVEVNGQGHKSVMVEYSDLNVASNAGAKVLRQRIGSAAEQVCNVASGVVSIRQAQKQKSCVVETVNAAVNRLDKHTS
ncbi:MAG: UrcA family protein [Candidatus Azotimanducaceae bacterium]|jgi:UrcA family protein